MFGLNLWNLVLSLFVAGAFFAACFGCLVLYRLILHPLAKFPGPKLAAATGWYETVVDLFGGDRTGGHFVAHMDELHRIYGPIIRVNPDELHVKDPEWYDVLYRGGRRDKNNVKYLGMNDCPGSIVSTRSRDLHRSRRTPLNPYFSKRSIEKFEGRVRSNVQDLINAVKADYVNTGKLFPVDGAFVALTLDVITDYCFGKSWNCVVTPDFAPEWRRASHGMFDGIPFARQFPWVTPLMNKLPVWFMEKINPGLALIVDAQNAVQRQVEDILKEREANQEQIKVVEKLDSYDAEAVTNEETIFHAILNSPMDDSEKTAKRLRDECFVIVTAGMDTTAKTLTRVLWHLMTDPVWLKRVLKEVDEVMPDKNILPSCTELERLPVLNAAIKETLRCHNPVIHRMPVIEPVKTLKYGEWEIPPGTTVDMCVLGVHLDPAIFPEPEVWDPNRWMGEQAATSMKYLIPFCRGSRACLGLNLAWAELHLTLAGMLRNFELEFVDVVKARDIDVTRDLFLGMHSKESKGINAKVLGVRA